MAFWKESMINRLSNLINRNRSAAKISQVLCSSIYPARALSALGLLLADGALTVGWGKTFCRVGGSPSRKRL